MEGFDETSLGLVCRPWARGEHRDLATLTIRNQFETPNTRVLQLSRRP